MTFAQFQAYAQMVDARRDRIARSITDRARVIARQAGLDPTIAFLHAHNAMCSFEYGHPWPEVDYRLVRRVLWLERRSWEPGRIADRIIARAWAKHINTRRSA